VTRNETPRATAEILVKDGLWCVSSKWRYHGRWLVRCGVGYFLTREDLSLPEYEGILPQWQASLSRERTRLVPTGETFSAGRQLILRAFAGENDPTQTRIYLLERYILLHDDPAHYWLIHPRAILITNADGDPVGAWATFRPRVRISRVKQPGTLNKGTPLVIDPVPEATRARNLGELFERLFE
jgi:hypothetical protein